MPGTRAVRDGERAAGADDRPRVPGRPVLPSARAVVGGLLLAVAAVVTFATWQSAAGAPDTSYTVASRPLRPGERVGAGDVRMVPVELPSGLAGRSFTRAGDVVGRVALGPIGEGELLQQGQLSEGASPAPRVEVSFALARDRALDGQLRSGDRVDVFATYDDRTDEVVQGAQVVAVSGGDVPALTAGDQVTITVAIEEVDRRAELVHAVRAGEVTLVRSTLHPESGSGGPPAASVGPGGSAPAGSAGPTSPGSPAGSTDRPPVFPEGQVPGDGVDGPAPAPETGGAGDGGGGVGDGGDAGRGGQTARGDG